MKKSRFKTFRRVVSLVLLMVLVIVLAAMPLLARREAEEEFPVSILESRVEERQIALALSGGGTLEALEAVSVTVPAQVKLTEFLVSNGDTLQAGDPIARVDRVSVMSAIASVQEVLTQLDKELEQARTTNQTQTLTASGGLVKAVYAAPGDSVQQVMLDHGALAVISLDGRMAVTIPCEAVFSSGDALQAQIAGQSLPATVKSCREGYLVATFPDDGFASGQSVTLLTPEGQTLGSGECYIHSPWNAVAYSGTVDRVFIREGQTLSTGDRVMTLNELGYSAEYRSLAQRHREYEELMLELFTLYQTGTLLSPGSGVVTGIDENSPQLLASSGGAQITLLANAPGENPDGQYLNFIGQVTKLGSDGMILRLNPHAFRVSDYADLSGVSTSTDAMTETVRYSSTAPIYQRVGDGWVQLAGASPGDILLFAGASSGSIIWAVKVGSAPIPGEPTPPPVDPPATDPTDPDGTTDPTDPEATDPDATAPGSDPTTPSQPQIPGGGIPSFGGSYGGSGGAGSAQEEELYPLDTVEIASVSPRKTLEIPITVDEQDIHHVGLGSTVTVTVDALIGRSWQGTVTQIGHIGANTGGSSKYTVTVTLPWEENMLPGMNAAVSLPLETCSGPAVPVAALASLDGQTVVYTALDPKTGEPASPVPVIPGKSDGDYVLLEEGPAPETAVYYPYYEAETPRP